MSVPNSGDINTAEANDERNSLDVQDMADVNSADSSPSTFNMSEEVGRQIRLVNDPLSKKLEPLFGKTLDGAKS